VGGCCWLKQAVGGGWELKMGELRVVDGQNG